MNLDPRFFGYDDTDDIYEDDYSQDYNERPYSEQCYADRSDYARELYESGRIDRTQMDEMRMGA